MLSSSPESDPAGSSSSCDPATSPPYHPPSQPPPEQSDASRQELRFRQGTVLICQLPVGAKDCIQLAADVQLFMLEVYGAAAAFGGVVHEVTLHQAVIGWNLFQFHPSPQAQACHCALHLETQLRQAFDRQSQMVVVAAHFVSGYVQGPSGPVSILHGKHYHAALRLLQLNETLECSILLNESVSEAVQGTFATLAVDVVQPEGLEHSVQLHALLPRPPFVPPDEDLDLYQAGFQCMRRGDFEAADQHLTEYLTTGCSETLTFARRLLDIASSLEPNRRGFCRRDGWQPYAVEQSRYPLHGLLSENSMSASSSASYSSFEAGSDPPSTPSLLHAVSLQSPTKVAALRPRALSHQPTPRAVRFGLQVFPPIPSPAAGPIPSPAAGPTPSPAPLNSDAGDLLETPPCSASPTAQSPVLRQSGRLRRPPLMALCIDEATPTVSMPTPSAAGPSPAPSSTSVASRFLAALSPNAGPSLALPSPSHRSQGSLTPQPDTHLSAQPHGHLPLPRSPRPPISPTPLKSPLGSFRAPLKSPLGSFRAPLKSPLGSFRPRKTSVGLSSFRFGRQQSSHLTSMTLTPTSQNGSASLRVPRVGMEIPRRRRLSAWSLGSDVALVESDNSDDEPMPPLLGNAFPFQTTSKAGDRKLWYCSDTMIGSGAFGMVFLGMSAAGPLVAVKQMEIAPEKNSQLLNEIKLLSRFQHDNIVAYLGSAVVGPHVLVVMEFAVTALSRVMASFGKLSLPCSRRYTRDITAGLQYLHSNDVIHRDIKPQNVLIGQSGLCKLADFGTASLLTKVQQGKSEPLVGTPQYMAPEMMHGYVGREGDVWALGVTVWQMLTGALLDDLQNLTNVVAVIFRVGNITETPQMPHDFSDDVKEFLRLCLCPNRTSRATVDDLLTTEFLTATTSSTLPRTPSFP